MLLTAGFYKVIQSSNTAEQMLGPKTFNSVIHKCATKSPHWAKFHCGIYEEPSRAQLAER